jgi:hypothetical protein
VTTRKGSTGDARCVLRNRTDRPTVDAVT